MPPEVPPSRPPERPRGRHGARRDTRDEEHSSQLTREPRCSPTRLAPGSMRPPDENLCRDSQDMDTEDPRQKHKQQGNASPPPTS